MTIYYPEKQNIFQSNFTLDHITSSERNNDKNDNPNDHDNNKKNNNTINLESIQLTSSRKQASKGKKDYDKETHLKLKLKLLWVDFTKKI